MVRNGVRLCGTLALAWGVWCCLAAAAFALPAGREYEMVSPVFKGGFGATGIEGVAPDGESAAYVSFGAFNGAPSGPELSGDYLARRSASGWSTVPLIEPASLLAEQGPKDLSPTMDMEFATGHTGPTSQNPLLETEDLLLHSTSLPDVAANWKVSGELGAVDKKEEVGMKYVQASVDFCHVLLSTNPGVLLEEAAGTPSPQLYEFNRACGSESASVALVGLNNRDKLNNRGCDADVGIEHFGAVSNDFNAINSDGSEVFFTDCLSGGNEPGSPHQLFVRLGGSKTLEVSRPLEPSKPFGGCAPEVLPGEAVPGEVPCQGASTRASADFAGASKDGSRVYFVTSSPLVAADPDAAKDVYMAMIGCPQGKPSCSVAENEVTSLTQVSRDPSGGPAEVQGVVRVAPDGQRAYFVASGDLLTSAQRMILEGEGRPVPHPGAANLYVYDASVGTTAFVGDFCSGKETSGAVEDVRCPSAEADTSLWSSGGEFAGETQTAGTDGRFLVFASNAQLTRDDTNVAKDVFRYDAETGALERISTGEDGYGVNRTSGGLGAQIAQGHYGSSAATEGGVRFQYEMNNRAISEDGSRIVFTSAEPLSPAATNGLVNAYEWHAGSGSGESSMSLISTGSDEGAVDDVVISPNGLSVFFDTVQGLVPQDTDGAPDIYDARLEGGFPPPAGERRPCEGDACQGPLTNPAPLLVPGSVSQAPGGNFVAPKQPLKPKKKTRARKKVKARKRAGKKGKASASSGRAEKASERSVR
jgi:hypothetical protein